MQTIPIPKNISFRAETMFANNKGKVGRLRCDENGIYKGLPMMVLGEVTQQNTYYDPVSMVDQITNPTSRFNMVYKAGKMFGEYGHPSFIGMTGPDQLQRLCTVDERNTSHVFTGLYTDQPTASGTVVLRGDIKPHGPMGRYLKESLDDPIINTAFSLRAYVETKVRPDGLKYRTVRSLTTFDTVGASGYKTTDKAHAIGLESFAGDNFIDFEINIMNDGNLVIDQVALETLSNTELNEIFGVSSIAKVTQSRTIVKTDPSMMQKFPNLYRNGVFNDYFKEIK